MSSPPASEIQNSKTPCNRSFEDWPICYADGCYLNYRCPIYSGKFPSPIRDYIPMPPVFILLEPFEAIPISYLIPIKDSESNT